MNSSPQLNEEQKKAAFCDENAVVAAGAGSGKTMVLANRFAWLLTEKGYKVDEILTLTFTKKAASQMFKRIYSLVSEIAERETGIKGERARRALDDFIHARIQTLDSYSASIVKQCALRYGISPDFKIDQERCYNIALEISYPFFIANRHHPAVEKLYSDNRPSSIVHNVFANILFNYCHIDKPRDFSAEVKNQLNNLCTEWKNCSEEINLILNNLENDIQENEALLPALLSLMKKHTEKKTEIPQENDVKIYINELLNTSLESAIEKSESHPIQKQITDFLFFINSIITLNLRSGKRSDNPVKDNIKKLRSFNDLIMSLSISCMQAGFLLSIMSLFSDLQNRYINKKRAEGVLTFRDIANLSRTILVEQKDIRQSEKESFKSIMIDEFQDNNELQKDILFLLAENLDVLNCGIPAAKDLKEGKLFFVGDEKQSIYFFRGADVSVFRKLKEELNTKDITLKTNYRSSLHLINAFNIIFGGISNSAEKSPSVFAHSESLPLYEAYYTSLKAGSAGEGNLSFCILNKKNITENNDTILYADESEAYFVARKIKQLIKQKYQPHEIAILFRSRSSQHLYEKHLRALGIPYTCEDINDLFYGGPVNDIMSVLRLAAYPTDKAAYAEMLRSPFAGLSIQGTALCLLNDKPFDDKALNYLDEDDQKKYKNGQKIYSSICKKCESENISSLVSELWFKEGYCYETEWNSQLSAYRELFDYLFHLAASHDAENHGLASFTDSMISLRNSGGQLSDIEIPLERPSAVHLMTIHKSKGLEFPVVFLCGCGKKSQTEKCDIVYHSDNAGIVFSPPPPLECRGISGKRNNFYWEQANEEIKRKRTAELRRLLYVGMTRAENELYLTGSLNMENEDGIKDFSVFLKKHIENKYEKNENYIEGDSIINNDTLFGLLLPAIISHIPDSGLKSGFFNLEEIPNYSEENVRIKGTGNSYNVYLKRETNKYIRNILPFYENAQVIKTPILHNNHITPANIKSIEEDTFKEHIGRGYFISKDYSGEKSDDIFNKVDSVLSAFLHNKNSAEKFNSGSFGTVAHICIEALLKNEEVVIPSSISGLLNPEEMSELLEAGIILAKRFVHSPLGTIAKNANMLESEFSFRSLIKNKKRKEVFINGTIDLFFEDNGSIHIIDFKTDSREKPAEHLAQISCYYNAISTLLTRKQCRIWLYYLRTGHAVEMTDKVSQFNIEKRIFNDIEKLTNC